MKKKSEVPRIMVRLVKHLKESMNCETKFLRCDNAGENVMTEIACLNAGLGIDFECTAVNTPQQNGRVERKFATLFGRVRAMLNGARLNGKSEMVHGQNVERLPPTMTTLTVTMRLEK